MVPGFRRRVVPILALAAILLASGLAGLPTRAQGARIEVPPEVKMVSAAIALRLRGVEVKDGVDHLVVFEPAAVRSLPVPRFNYVGFWLPSAIVTGFRLLPEKPPAAEVEGVLHFEDALGRRAFVGYTARYTAVGKNIHVTWAGVTTTVPPAPRIVAFFLPAERLTEAALEKFESNLEAFDFVTANAIRVNESGPLPRRKRDYYVVVFFMDRIGPADKVSIGIGTSRDGPFREAAATFAVDHGGWNVVMIRMKFALNGKDETFFRATYQPGGRIPGLDRQAVGAGVFSTTVPPPDATKVAPIAPPAAQPAPAAAPPAADESDPVKRLQVLQDLRRQGLISDDEYKLKRQQILDSL
jgi:hypothetical protein